MKNIWTELKKPIMVLAPMADVTDYAFRQIIVKCGSPRPDGRGKPDVFWTEFVAADGLAHPQAREKLMIDLKYTEGEHPIVAQIFGGKPDNIREAAKLCVELGFDGVDINMGCPDKSIEKQCAGSGMIKNPEVAFAVIQSAKEGATAGERKIPVSVKTRIGYNKNEIDTWIRGLLEQDIALLTVHLRTRKEMSEVPAHWDLMKDIVALRDEVAPNTLIFGNGDVKDLDEARQKVKETGCDGVMIGRGIFGNPWLFKSADNSSGLLHSSGGTFPEKNYLPTLTEKLRVMIEHTKLFEKELGQYKNFAIMKKHYKAYVNNFDGAKELRTKLMEAENSTEIEKMVNDFLDQV
ncbi:MAG: tRNA-dihydrouridine synthase [Candidatus Pacebacteria bacterium]|nr:tRNA-dihydrouridine synthase [Candidatus Paceibacterota bacterium]